MIIGFVGKDLELKYTQSQKAFANFTVATTEAWKDKNGQKQEQTEWHNVNVWGAQAKNCSRYLKKGSKVYVEGKIKTDTFEKNGEKRYSTKIQAQVVTFLSPPTQKGTQPNNYQGQSHQMGTPQNQSQSQPQQQPAYDPMDDIPFG